MKLNDILSENKVYIMGCAMISIMLFHQPFFFANYFVDFFHLYGHWGVELFLFVSGFGIVHSLQKNSVKVFYKNRIVRLLPSCIIVGILKLLFVYLGFKEHAHSNMVLLVTNIYLWYIYAIVVYYIMSPSLYKLLNKYGIWVVVAICIFSFICQFIPFGISSYYLINHLGWITARLPIYVLGMYIVIKPIKLKIKEICIVGSLFLFLCMVLQLGSIMVKYKWNVPYLNILLLFATPMLCILCSFVKKVFERLRLQRILELTGVYSLELYLWHEYVYWNVYRNNFFADFSSTFNCIIALCIILILVFVTIKLKEVVINKMLWF